MQISTNSEVVNEEICKKLLRCPWEGRKREFSNGEFTIDDKIYIILKIISKNSKISKWLINHKIDRSFAYRWARNTDNGLTLHCQP
jgi:hypothetical protein